MTVEVWVNNKDFIESANLMNQEINFVGIKKFKYNDKDKGKNYAVLESKSKDSKGKPDLIFACSNVLSNMAAEIEKMETESQETCTLSDAFGQACFDTDIDDKFRIICAEMKKFEEQGVSDYTLDDNKFSGYNDLFLEAWAEKEAELTAKITALSKQIEADKGPAIPEIK